MLLAQDHLELNLRTEARWTVRKRTMTAPGMAQPAGVGWLQLEPVSPPSSLPTKHQGAAVVTALTYSSPSIST